MARRAMDRMRWTVGAAEASMGRKGERVRRAGGRQELSRRVGRSQSDRVLAGKTALQRERRLGASSSNAKRAKAEASSAGRSLRAIKQHRKGETEGVKRDSPRFLTPGAAELRKMQLRCETERSSRLRKKSGAWSFYFQFMLFLSFLLAVGICLNYVQLHTEINTREQRIERLRDKLEKRRSENDAMQNYISNAVSPDEIYQVATKELGMIYAGEEQIIHYKRAENGYVRQYEEIPKH